MQTLRTVSGKLVWLGWRLHPLFWKERVEGQGLLHVPQDGRGGFSGWA